MEKNVNKSGFNALTTDNKGIRKYVNNVHCPGNRALFKVESYKYASPTNSRTSVWVDYFYSYEQFKRCWSHNSYMDAEKLYGKKGRSWVEIPMA